MNKKELYNYAEVIADIAYSAGAERLRINGNSRTAIKTIIAWADEFMLVHKDTDWEEVEYLDTIYAFTEAKLSEFIKATNHPCPQCSQKSLKCQDDMASRYYAIHCYKCGFFNDGQIAEKMLKNAPDVFPIMGQVDLYNSEAAMNDQLIVKETEGDTIDVWLSPDKTPETYERKVRCYMLSGVTREEAEKYVLETPLVLELFYDIGRGLFAVESEPLLNISIYNPYTGEEIPVEEEIRQLWQMK